MQSNVGQFSQRWAELVPALPASLISGELIFHPNGQSSLAIVSDEFSRVDPGQNLFSVRHNEPRQEDAQQQVLLPCLPARLPAAG